MVGPAEASAAIGGIKVAIDMAKGIAALKSEKEINEKVIEIQRVLLDAQLAAINELERRAVLIRRIEELETTIAKNEDWGAERSRYKLTQHSSGAMTYDLRPELTNEEIPHRLCTNCFDDGRKIIIQTVAKHSGGEVVECPSCKTRLTLSPFSRRNIHNDRGSGYC